MDIDLLSKMVKELILDNDEVTLPGVGSFVAEIVPSSFSDKGYTINPPYRRLSFRQKEAEDGNLLTNLYAKSNNIDSETASRILKEFLTEMRNILEAKKLITFPGLGRLRATKENHFFFIADEDLDIYPEGFGLEPISLKTHEETMSEVSDTIATLRNILNPEPADAEVNADVPTTVEQMSESGGNALPSDEAAPESTEPSSDDEPVIANDSDHSEGQSQASLEAAHTENAEATEETTDAEARTEDNAEATTEAVPESHSEAEPETATAPATEAEAMASTDSEATDEEASTETEPEATAVTPVTANAPDMETKSATATALPAGSDTSVQTTEDSSKPKDEATTGQDRHKGVKILKWILIVLAVLALTALAAFLILAHIAPDFIDSILYTPEELEILNL